MSDDKPDKSSDVVGEFNAEPEQEPHSESPSTKNADVGEYGPSTPDASDDHLSLPEGGLVAMRRSGGFRFTSMEVVVYHNGQFTVQGSAIGGQSRPASGGRLSDAKMGTLFRALDGANFPNLAPAIGRQSPDAYAYEITARIGANTYSLEVFDGSIPKQLVPLIRFLSRYMRGSPGV